ncbi:MAG TPA: glycosyltransferase [Geminicoccus sp.]|uniref:glycosyltransferase n=1 Tax=Geminicoccus sp. TaxID=2024832 RepID=UPI002BA30EF7|nr:glycosyltransferase [Geminicoccus sp.]HWL69248.1 glycosyltransferase [Geminicoccus sp.]
MSGHDVVVCFGFEADRVRRQPWHVARGIALGLLAHGRRVTIVTDARSPPGGEPFRIVALPRLFSGNAPDSALRDALVMLAPDRIFVMIGIHELLRPGRLRLGARVFPIVAAQPFRPRDVLRLSAADLWRERHLLRLTLLAAFLPDCLIRQGFRQSGATGLVFVSAAARARFAEMGIGVSLVLRPQVEPPPSVPTQVRSPVPTILYCGPPLALRGADLALDAFERASAAGLEARLQLLLRPDDRPSLMRRFLARVERSPVRTSIEVVTEMLPAEAMRRHLAAADVHLLPFRVTVSDAPLVVIEAGLTGRPMVVLDTPGVAEYARAFGGIVVDRPARLVAALRDACGRAVQPIAVQEWTSWPQAVAPLDRWAGQTPPRLATIALIGIDGAGKTTLLRRLQGRLAAAGQGSTHVWSRFRNYTSKPLLVLARLTGHNRKLVLGGVRIGVHEFANGLAGPFLWLQRLDLWLDRQLRIRPAAKRGLVVMDRCALDQLVDMAVATGREAELVERLAPNLLEGLPQPALVVLVDREPLLIGTSRPDALMDPKLLRRRACYRLLAARLHLPVLQNDASLEAADRFLDRLVGLAPEPGGRRARG